MATNTGAGVPARPFRIILRWQLVATVLSALACALYVGQAGAVSAALGGAVAVAGSLTFMLLLPDRIASTPWDSLGVLLKAEGAKVLVMVVLLCLVMMLYKGIFAIGFIATFTIAVIIFSMAIFVRNPVSPETGENNVN